METTKKFDLSSLGETTGKPFNGSFVIKTVLTRAERFEADRRRREILGTNGAEALPDLQLEAFMLGQLAVRVVEAPDWWKMSGSGQLLEDANIIAEIWKLTREKEDEAKAELKTKAEAALKTLTAAKS